MRLNSKERFAILSAFQSVLTCSYKLYLFGSRTDDTKKGGDIDLLVLVSCEDKDQIINLKSKLKLEIFKNIPEQKIDITVATDQELKTDLFLSSLKDHMLPLSD